MNTIHTTATLGIDGMLHVPIPGAKPGVTYEVTVQAKPASPGLLAGEVLKDSLGILDEETEFECPPQGVLPPCVPWKPLVPIPGAKPGGMSEVKAAEDAVDEFGWPIGFHERMYGCITDEKFVAPDRGMPRPVPPLDVE